MFLFAEKNKRKKQKRTKKKKRKNNDTLWHAFVININELRNEPRRIEDKAEHGTHAHGVERERKRERGTERESESEVWGRAGGAANTACTQHTVYSRYQVSGQTQHYTNDMTLDKPKCKLAYKPGFVCSTFLLFISLSPSVFHCVCFPCLRLRLLLVRQIRASLLHVAGILMLITSQVIRLQGPTGRTVRDM